MGGGSYFSGAIDEVRVYNRALTANEIKALYEAGLHMKAASVFSAACFTLLLPSPQLLSLDGYLPIPQAVP